MSKSTSAPAIKKTKEELLAYLSLMNDENSSFPDRINGMMMPKYVDCDIEQRSVTIEYDVKPWEANRVGILHGGIICTMLDHAAGAVVSAFAGEWCPTIDIDVHFVRTGSIGETMTVVGEIIHLGRKAIHAEAKIFEKSTGKLIANCLATYLSQTAGV